jgi:hypothetical protein
MKHQVACGICQHVVKNARLNYLNKRDRVRPPTDRGEAKKLPAISVDAL